METDEASFPEPPSGERGRVGRGFGYSQPVRGLEVAFKMARRAESLNETVAAAIEPVITRICSRIADLVAVTVADRVRAELAKAGVTTRYGRRREGRLRNLARPTLTRWVADRRARRVPTFVIEMTGLDTKKKVVAKYGAGATFAKGKPLPPVAVESLREAPKAKPPIIRKKATAA